MNIRKCKEHLRKIRTVRSRVNTVNRCGRGSLLFDVLYGDDGIRRWRAHAQQPGIVRSRTSTPTALDRCVQLKIADTVEASATPISTIYLIAPNAAGLTATGRSRAPD